MVAKTAAEKRVEELEKLKAALDTPTTKDDKAALEAQIAELEKKVEADKAKAEAPKKDKTVNLDKAFKKAHKTFATGAQEMVRRTIRER